MIARQAKNHLYGIGLEHLRKWARNIPVAEA
jgi:hypothetical protein